MHIRLGFPLLVLGAIGALVYSTMPHLGAAGEASATLGGATPSPDRLTITGVTRGADTAFVRTPLPPPPADVAPTLGEPTAADAKGAISAQDETAAALVELDGLQVEAMRLLRELRKVNNTLDRRIYVDSSHDIPEPDGSMQIIRGYAGDKPYFVPVMRSDAVEFFRVQDAAEVLRDRPDVVHALALRALVE